MDLDLFENFTDTGPVSRSISASLTTVSTNRKRILQSEEVISTNKISKSIPSTSVYSTDEGQIPSLSQSIPNNIPNDPNSNLTASTPAKVYKFKLDGFQREAIGYIDRNESVLVAAHTSAGKTAVAEYAIAKSLRDKQRVIYTSPIKALSNQKFRDLQEEFGDIGLMTGDMTINPHATCLIMTTEILRSMLYRGSEVVREVAWVIYDEVHYMRDKERGVVWEESIILLPHKVRFVFLSATIPNAPVFVAWVQKIHHQPCHVVYTDYRPVPLRHYIFPSGAEGLFLVVDEKSQFREDSFQRAMASLQQQDKLLIQGENPSEYNNNSSKKPSRKQITKNATQDLLKIISLIREKSLDPCIIFSFSKKECEAYALKMSQMEFTSEEEKHLIEKIFQNAIDALSEEDQQLPQIISILPLLKKGVGIHHGGLLPIIKEVVEILFQEGFLKCLFATETFSIGINMPAKTVVFTSTRKFDGKDFRWITSGEYIQMSGRAGRRGKDDKGIVIQMIDEKMEPDIVKSMIYGASDPLHSSYHISYNMVLNMMRVEDADPEKLMKCSFQQFEQEQESPKLIREAEEYERSAKEIVIPHEKEFQEYMNLMNLEQELSMEINRLVMQPVYILPFLQSGRMVSIRWKGQDWGWGTIITAKKLDENNSNIAIEALDAASKKNKKKTLTEQTTIGYEGNRWIGSTAKQLFLKQQQLLQSEQEEEEWQQKQANAPGTMNGKMSQQPCYYLDVLLNVKLQNQPTLLSSSTAAILSSSGVMTASADALDIAPAIELNNMDTEFTLVHVALDAIRSLSAVRLNIPNDLSKQTNKIKIRNAVKEVCRRFAATGGLPVLDATDDLGVPADHIRDLVEKQKVIQTRLRENPTYLELSSNQEILKAYQTKQILLQHAEEKRRKAKELQSVAMRDELKKRKKILRRLEYVNAEGVLSAKGRFACEVTSGDELVLTNMVFAGVFNVLTVEQTVGLLSCMVHHESGSNATSNPHMRSEMQKPFRQLQTIAREVVKVCMDVRLISDEQEFMESFDPALIDVCYAWAAGTGFVEICKMTDIFEGSIIRSLRRLEELLRQLSSASQAIGNNELVELFSEGARKIRRGVVFAASLYL